ncbi:immediate early response 3-interacting protein 1-like [Sycon ciliatum]|uniref:immediate early response 3-interacting protein 1-like n=1 Tax=Sycon ciliatum TaxID=27933 RepID=UPI0031F6842C
MALTLGSLLQAILLMVNAIAILHEQRFLAKVGWGSDAAQTFGEPTVKSKIITLINSVRTLLRVPLIGVNVVVIAYELVLG